VKDNLRYLWPLHIILLITNWLPDNVIFLRLRGFLASFFFKKCGKNLRLGRNITFYKPYEMEIGDNIYIAYGAWLNGEIVIESDVMFGPYCMVASSNHTFQNGSFRYGGNEDKGKIIIGYGSWVGGMCSILAGARLGKNCLLASNSVLNKEMEDGSIYGGTPARVIGKVNQELNEISK
jgi:acetyltransferase-like isoleucine patch superfamily enzyme